MLHCVLAFQYLFEFRSVWGNEPVALANEGSMVASADGIHLPVGVVVVHDMDDS